MTRYPVACPVCGETRLLKKWDANKAERLGSPCFGCSQAIKARKGFQAMVKRYVWKWAMRHVQAYRLANPTATEEIVGALLDTLGYEYVQEYRLATKTTGRRQWVALVDFMAVMNGQMYAIEVNGGVHVLPHKQKNDQRKARLLKRRGIPLLTLTDSDIPQAREYLAAFLPAAQEVACVH